MNRVTIAAPALKPFVEAIKSIDARSYEESRPTLELCYNGDYPGFACIKVNGRWATDAEEKALVSIFGARGIKHLFDILGAERSDEEHKRYSCKLIPTPVLP